MLIYKRLFANVMCVCVPYILFCLHQTRMMVHNSIPLMHSMQMLRHTVNTFMDSFDKKDYNIHRARASTMDINDVMEPRSNFPPIVEEPIPGLKTDDDDDKHFSSQLGAGLSPMPSPVVRELGFDECSPINVTPNVFCCCPCCALNQLAQLPVPQGPPLAPPEMSSLLSHRKTPSPLVPLVDAPRRLPLP